VAVPPANEVPAVHASRDPPVRLALDAVAAAAGAFIALYLTAPVAAANSATTFPLKLNSTLPLPPYRQVSRPLHRVCENHSLAQGAAR
jgi:hypothetical protein